MIFDRIDQATWRVTEWLVSLPMFFHLVVAFTLATIIVTGLMETPR